jgi:hypothetical protein
VVEGRTVTERKLPEANEFERQALGSMLLNTEARDQGLAMLQEIHFGTTQHRKVYAAIRAGADAGEPADPALVNDRIRQRGDTEATGGAAYLGELMGTVGAWCNVGYYGQKVIEAYARRLLVVAGGDIARNACDATCKVGDLRTRVESALTDLDSIPFPIGGDLAGIESGGIVPASRLAERESITWLWEGYLAPGYVTLLTGLWKAGKSTLVGHLLRMLGSGGHLGGRINAERVLTITEEGGGLWARRCEDLGIGDWCDFWVRPFKGTRPAYDAWREHVRRVAGVVKARDCRLVIYDTFVAVSPIRDENDAAAMLDALTPLHAITEAGAALLLVHHPRKGDASEGQASRGSGALPGWVDVICELRRFDPQRRDDRRRVLTTFSRFDESPPEVVLELTDAGYVTCGSKSDAKQQDRFAVIGDILNGDGSGLTADRIRDLWPEGDDIPRPGLRTIRRDLSAGVAGKLWGESGAGAKGDPLRYRIGENAIPASPYSYRTGIESEDGNGRIPQPSRGRAGAFVE